MKDTLDPGTIDLFGGKAERDKGMASSLSHDPTWTAAALNCVAHLPADWKGSGQDIRIRIVPIIGEPKDPNHAWGALTNAAIHKGLIVATGHYKYARLRASHKRRIPVYRRCA
jgi:hypothetical protein